MANNNIERLNKYVEDYLYKCFEEYSQFKYTYEELIGDHDSLEDYIIDEVLKVLQMDVKRVDLPLVFRRILNIIQLMILRIQCFI